MVVHKVGILRILELEAAADIGCIAGVPAVGRMAVDTVVVPARMAVDRIEVAYYSAREAVLADTEGMPCSDSTALS